MGEPLNLEPLNLQACEPSSLPPRETPHANQCFQLSRATSLEKDLVNSFTLIQSDISLGQKLFCHQQGEHSECSKNSASSHTHGDNEK